MQLKREAHVGEVVVDDVWDTLAMSRQARFCKLTLDVLDCKVSSLLTSIGW
jgi:hypothetical protein